MKKSQCTIIVPNHVQQDEYIVYNTRTQALMSVPGELKNAIEALPSLDAFTEHGDVLDQLYKNGIIVKDDAEDAQLLRDYLQQLETRSDIMSFEVTVLTTFQCNFACAYCFEQGSKDNTRMTAETVRDLFVWLKNETILHNYEHIHITFYGGEPLLNTEPLFALSRMLHEWTKKHGITFTFGMITNGYCIDPAAIDAWVPLGLSELRITIDGDQASHDTRRPLIGGGPSFATIIKNMKAIIDKPVKVSISGNYDRDNVEAMVRLLDFLEQEKLLRRLDRIGFTPILPRFGEKSQPGAIEYADCMATWGTEYFDMNQYIRREMRKRGLPVPAGLGYMGCSLVSRHNGVTVAPDGTLYKCPTMVGYSEFSVGKVQEQGYNTRLEEFVSIRAWKRCDSDCPYVPVCSGGCRFMTYVRDGDFKGIFCERDALDRRAAELIQCDYETYLEG